MSLLQIHLPEDAKQLADEQIARGRFNNISDYIAALIRRDHQELEDEAVEDVLKERLRSGPSTGMTDDDFNAIRLGAPLYSGATALILCYNKLGGQMTISLSSETQKLLDDQMKKGRFATVDETMRAALRSLDESTRTSDYDDLPAETREIIEESDRQIDRGGGRPWNEVRAEILSQFTRE